MSTDGRRRSPQSWEHLLEKDPHTGAGFRLGITAAVLIHAGIFAVTWPTIAQTPPAEPDPIVIVCRLYDFTVPPEPPPPAAVTPPPITRRVPIIPGTPPKDEPVRVTPIEDVPLPDVPVIYMPPAVEPPPDSVDEPPEIVTATIDIDEPTIIHRIEPRYTQPAIRGHVQGTVILELIIDTEGLVESVGVLRGLPLGLTKSATDAVEQWRFEPSTYNDHPVAVRYILTVHFNLR